MKYIKPLTVVFEISIKQMWHQIVGVNEERGETLFSPYPYAH